MTFIIFVENLAVSLILALLKYDRLNKGFPCGSADKESACNVGDLGSFPRLGRSPGEGNDHTLQYSGLENSMDRGDSWTIVHEVTKSGTRLSD